MAVYDLNGDAYLESLYSNPADTVLAQNIPALTLSAYGGGEAVLSIPNVTLIGHGVADYIASLSKSLPAITLSALAYQEGIASLEAYIPAITLVSAGTLQPNASATLMFPAVTLTASALAGFTASLEKSIGAITLDANSFWTGTNGSIMYIPSIELYARARGTITSMCMNTKNMGLTKYTNFNYNSLCMFNGVAIGATRTGIYELTGTEDNEDMIPWKIRTGKLDLVTHKLRHVWLSGTITGDIKMIIETPDGERYEYDIEPVSETEDEIRVKIGKGLGSRYVNIEFQNESVETITLDKIQVYGMPGARR